MGALGRLVDLKMTGAGFPDFESADKEVEKFEADIVVWYKPLLHIGYEKVKIPKIIRYNEMRKVEWTKKEITESKSNLIICHHLNEMSLFKDMKGKHKFINLSHSYEPRVFYNQNLEKDYDIIVVGDGENLNYPFRTRLRKLVVEKMSHKWRTFIVKYPGPKNAKILRSKFLQPEYAKIINQSKITLSCSSKWGYALGKYFEIPPCNSLLGTNLPDERHDFFGSYVLEIDMKMSDEEIIERIEYYLNHEKERQERVDFGVNLMKDYTTDKYAERFLKIIENYLRNK